MQPVVAFYPSWSMLAPVVPERAPGDLERERETIELAQSGDRAALGRLLSHHGPALYRTVLLPRLGSEHAAQDALAETYAKVVERIGQFSWQGVGFYPWLRTVALRVALDALRRKGRVVLWSEDDIARELDARAPHVSADAALTAHADERASKAKVTAALERIHPRYAHAIRVRLLEERPRDEAAALLGVTPPTFDVLLHRALRALKSHLQPSSPDDA
jgi:RNA polymerase sigma factor (sigma-70 family)